MLTTGNRGALPNDYPDVRFPRRSRSATYALLALSLAAVTVVAGCADRPVPAASAGATSTAGSSSTPEGPLPADVTYMSMMVPHHDQGLFLTTLVPDRASSEALERLTVTMDNQHVEELGQIQGLLRSWGRPVPGAGADPAMRASMGMASDAELARLGTLRGPAFDQEWIRVMIRHHQGAIDMSRTLLAGPHGRVAGTFADALARVQQDQVETMSRIAAGAWARPRASDGGHAGPPLVLCPDPCSGPAAGADDGGGGRGEGAGPPCARAGGGAHGRTGVRDGRRGKGARPAGVLARVSTGSS